MNFQILDYQIHIYQNLKFRNYHMDQHSLFTDENLGLKLEKNYSNRKEKTSIPSFIAKAYQILEKQEHSDIIIWSENGLSFFVKNIKEFEEKILPIYFRHKNFASFVRQLNMYDFHKIRGQQKHIFEHRLFQRDAKHLLSEIKRKCFKKQRDESDDDCVSEQRQEPQEQFPKKKNLNTLIQMNMNVYLEQDESKKLKLQCQKKSQPKNYTFVLIQKQKEQNKKKNKELINEIIMNLKDICPKSDKQIRQRINEIKKNPKYQTLKGKNYIFEIYKKIKENLYSLRPRTTLEDLDELSIEQEILYNQIQKPSKFKIVSLTNFETEKLINKSEQQGIKFISGEDHSRQFF